MIHYTTGNILKSAAEALVNTVNTEGVMGKGLALQFKKRFPDNFKAYEKACKSGQIVIGKMFSYVENLLTGRKVIINFPTKASWRSKSDLSSISLGLEDLANVLKEQSISSVAVPPLGCGLGGLSWNLVKSEIERILAPHKEFDVYVYEPLQGNTFLPMSSNNSRLTETKAAVLVAFRRYMQYALATSITYVEAQKLCYFLQTMGLPLKFSYKPYRYGPYTDQLPNLLGPMEGVWITGYHDHTINAFDTFELLDNAIDAESMLTKENKLHLERTFDLIEGYEDPFGMELLATIHWLMQTEEIPLLFEPIKSGMTNWCKGQDPSWGQRKIRLFSDELIKRGIERVNSKFFVTPRSFKHSYSVVHR